MAAFDRRCRNRFVEHLRAAQSSGDLSPDEDIDQLFFEIDAYLLYAHAAFAFRGEPAVLDRAAEAVRGRLGRDGPDLVRPVAPGPSAGMSPTGRPAIEAGRSPGRKQVRRD